MDNENEALKRWVNRKKVKFVPKLKCATLDEFLKMHEISLHSYGLDEIRERKQRFLEAIEHPGFYMMTPDEQARMLDISKTTLERWKVECPDDVWSAALKKQRERAAAETLEVKAALLRECLRDKGDAKHKELWLRWVEGWNPASSVEFTRGKDKEIREVSTVEIVKGLLEGMAPEQRKELGFSGGGEPIEEGGGGETQ